MAFVRSKLAYMGLPCSPEGQGSSPGRPSGADKPKQSKIKHPRAAQRRLAFTILVQNIETESHFGNSPDQYPASLADTFAKRKRIARAASPNRRDNVPPIVPAAIEKSTLALNSTPTLICSKFRTSPSRIFMAHKSPSGPGQIERRCHDGARRPIRIA
jgi:hypothetical protein